MFIMLIRGVAIGWAMLVAILVGGCAPTDKPEGVHITADTVSIDKAHVVGIKSELYQPSFYLSGSIQAVTTHTITLPDDAYLTKRHIAATQRVKKGDVLATFRLPNIHAEPTQENEHDDLATSDDPPKDPADTPDTNTTSTKVPATDEADTSTPSISPPATYDVTAPLSGIITAHQLGEPDHIITKGTSIITISDDRELKLISLLPKSHQDHLHIGDAVNFSTSAGKSFAGQVKQITPDTHHADMLTVHVLIKPDDVKTQELSVGQVAGGRTDYGSLSVGVLVPASAIMDDNLNIMDLSALNTPPHKPTTPIHAYVWVINQDEKLHLSPIEVISYIPKSAQVLVQGTVPLSGLIVKHPLPTHAKGKIVRLY